MVAEVPSRSSGHRTISDGLRIERPLAEASRPRTKDTHYKGVSGAENDSLEGREAK